MKGQRWPPGNEQMRAALRNPDRRPPCLRDPILAEILSAAPDSSSRLAAGCVNGLGAALLGLCVCCLGSLRTSVQFVLSSHGGLLAAFRYFAELPSSPILAGVAVLSTAFGHHRASCSLRCLGRRGCALESPAGPGVSRTGTKSFDECVLAGYGSGWYPRPGSRTPVFTVRNWLHHLFRLPTSEACRLRAMERPSCRWPVQHLHGEANGQPPVFDRPVR